MILPLPLSWLAISHDRGYKLRYNLSDLQRCIISDKNCNGKITSAEAKRQGGRSYRTQLPGRPSPGPLYISRHTLGGGGPSPSPTPPHTLLLVREDMPYRAAHRDKRPPGKISAPDNPPRTARGVSSDFSTFSLQKPILSRKHCRATLSLDNPTILLLLSVIASVLQHPQIGTTRRNN
jgi:hypothetical protein